MAPGDVQVWLSIALQVAMLAGVLVTVCIQVVTQLNVRKIEVATNSMKDALVAATAKSAGLEGEARGRAESANALNVPLAAPEPIPVVIASPSPLPVTLKP